MYEIDHLERLVGRMLRPRTQPLAGYSVSLSCAVAKRADETAYQERVSQRGLVSVLLDKSVFSRRWQRNERDYYVNGRD